MTNTNVTTDGTLAAAGSELSNAAKTTLGATTRGYTLEGIILNGAVPENTKQLVVELRFKASNIDGTAAVMAAALALGCETKTVKLKMAPAETTYFTTKVFIPTGSILYTWFNSPNLPAAATVNLWLTEV